MLPLPWLSSLPTASFKAGEQIITGGGAGEQLFFLRSGRVEVIRDGVRVALIKTPGSVFGELAVLLGIPATADVVVLDDAEFHIAEEPLEFLRTHPEVNLQVSRMLAFRLDAAVRYLVDVKSQLQDCSDHVAMVDGVLDAIVHRDLKKKVAP